MPLAAMKYRVMALVTALLCVGIANAAGAVPPITAEPTGQRNAGQLVWADLLTDNLDAAQSFYSEVFGWEFSGDNEYRQATHAGVPVAGFVLHEPRDPTVPEVAWLISISVSDVDAAAVAATSAGGSVLEAAQTVPDRGRYAVVEDNQGAPVALLRTSQGDPLARRTVDNEWIWAELWARDQRTAADFYKAVIGYEARVIREGDDEAYTVLTIGMGAGKGNGKNVSTGIVTLPWPDVLPHWLPYLRVANVADAISRIKQAGGYVLLPPRQEFDDGTVAIVSDPTGGAFAIQQRRAQQ